MNYAKLRTETEVKFSGPLKKPEDFRRVIKILTEELEIITSNVPQKVTQKPIKKQKENPAIAEFLEGTNEH